MHHGRCRNNLSVDSAEIYLFHLERQADMILHFHVQYFIMWHMEIQTEEKGMSQAGRG
jgi:hypothetical protein